MTATPGRLSSTAGLLAPLLDAPVVVVDTLDDPAAPVPALFPAEEALVARAVATRRREFAAVRGCARTALARLGFPPVPILPGQRGAPRWPDGVVGSMTHCAGYRAAAVAPADGTPSLGIDAEPAAPLRDPAVLRLIADAEERAALDALAVRQPEVPWDRLLFSAKESVYKTWFPLAGRWLGFHDARVDLDPDGTFTAHLLVPGPSVAGRPLTRCHGRWVHRDGLLLTAIALPAAPS